jgi:tripartite-type tricarboxylate transporter receptor subunit TctC
MMMFVAPPNSKLKTAAELVSAAKTTAQQLSVGSYTAGFQLSAAWFASVSGTPHVYVPYKGAPEVFLALMGDQLDWAVTDLIAAVPQVKAGKLKAIAVSGDKRHPDSPDVPTLKESGFPEYVNYTWTSIVIRAETPEPVTARLVETMQKILATQATKDFITKIGSEPLALAPAEMRKFQLAETERFRRIAAGAGIQPQ